MTTRKWIIFFFIATASGSAGGAIALSLGRTTTDTQRVDTDASARGAGSKGGGIIEAKEIILRDTGSKAYARICFFGKEPVMQFYDGKGGLKASVGIEGTEPFLRFERTDGSIASISPMSDGPGWYLLMLKSVGKGKGVFASRLTSDDLRIYQSGQGSVEAGNLKSGLGFQVVDKSGALVARMP